MKDNHFIPVFILEGFTDKNNRVWTYDKDTGKVFNTIPKETGFRKYYYAFIDENGNKDTEAIENILNIFETKGSNIIKNKIFKNQSLSLSEKQDFAIFIANLLVRVPNFRENKEQLFKKMALKTLKILSSNKEAYEFNFKKFLKETNSKCDIPIEELRQFALSEKYETKVDPIISLSSLFKYTYSIANIFINMHWIFIKASKDNNFIIADNPVFYDNHTIPKNTIWGIGLGQKNTYVLVPLSKKYAAYGSWEKKYTKNYLLANSDVVEFINKTQIINSQRFFYASINSNELKNSAIEFKGSSPKFRVS